ncbi:hypothetical protein KY339_00365 [Candidatus Woesearchaeota archaeon]|nr:hypothetical protein [Candidatus Woesearchaeota archaeon]
MAGKSFSLITLLYVPSFQGIGWVRIKPVMKYLKDKNVSFILSEGKSLTDVVAYQIVKDK